MQTEKMFICQVLCRGVITVDDLIEFLIDGKSKVWLFIFPFKELLFFKKSKYKLVRLFSILSPWLILPYTIFAWVVYACLWIILFVYMVLHICVNYVKDVLSSLRTFWDNV